MDYVLLAAAAAGVAYTLYATWITWRQFSVILREYATYALPLLLLPLASFAVLLAAPVLPSYTTYFYVLEAAYLAYMFFGISRKDLLILPGLFLLYFDDLAIIASIYLSSYITASHLLGLGSARKVSRWVVASLIVLDVSLALQALFVVGNYGPALDIAVALYTVSIALFQLPLTLRGGPSDAEISD